MIRKFIASNFRKPGGLIGIWAANMMIERNRKNYDRLIQDLNLQPGDKLLEIGYGPGEGIHTIAGICPSCTIHGIDFSRQMYKRASRSNKASIDSGKVQLQHGDFLKMPAAANYYDKVFCLNVVYFWNELVGPFSKIFSLLKKGGCFHIYMAEKTAIIKMKLPDSVFNKYSIEEVTEALRSAGFESVEHYLDKGYYIKSRK